MLESVCRGRSASHHAFTELSAIMASSWMLLAVLSLAATGCFADECKCGKNIAKYYTELGCRPVKEAGACCPTKYDCTAALGARSKDKCHLKGRAYDPNASLTSAEAGNVCVPSCRCLKFGPQAAFTCTHNDCPELFQDELAEGCVRLYAPDQCCSTGTHCGNAAGPAAKGAGKCTYAGKTYVHGQQFYPKEEPCKKCICQEGFDGTLNGPWCSEVSCGIELHYGAKILDGCAPVHFGTKGCCPIGWRCPSSADTVVPAAAKKKSSASANTCSFGKLRLGVGDALNKEKACVECACAVPPHVTCVQKGYC